MTRSHCAVREFAVPVGLALMVMLSSVAMRVTGASAGPFGDSALFGMAILAARLLLSLGAEAEEKYSATVSGGIP